MKSVKQIAPATNKVFVVHGRNKAVLKKVVRYLEKLNLTPIILHEQPDTGRTVIEKFIDYSDVSVIPKSDTEAETKQKDNIST